MGNSADPANGWATANTFYGGEVISCTNYGIRFVEAWGNVVNGVTIQRNAGPAMVAGVSFEFGSNYSNYANGYSIGNVIGNNHLIGCFLEANDMYNIRINSSGNVISNTNLGYWGAGLVTFAGTGANGLGTEFFSFQGSTPVPYQVTIDGIATGTETSDTFTWSENTIGRIALFQAESDTGYLQITSPNHGLTLDSRITIIGSNMYNQ